MRKLTWLAPLLLLAWILPQGAGAWEINDQFRLRGRLQMRYEILDKSTTKDGAANNETGWTSFFDIRRVRIDGTWDPSKYLRFVLELEFGNFSRFDKELYYARILNDAYARIRVAREFTIYAGNFKKPFSLNRITRAMDLLVPERGLMDDFLIADKFAGGFGSRDLGVMVSGTFKKLAGLNYSVGAFNAPEFLTLYQRAHKDFVVRLGVEPVKGLKIAIDGSAKQYTNEYDNNRYTWVYLVGADAAWTWGGLTVQAEGVYGENPNSAWKRKAVGGYGLVAYKFDLGGDYKLTPAVVVEGFDPDNQTPGVGLRLAGAINFDFLQYARLIVFFETAIEQPVVWDVTGTDPLAFGKKTRNYPTRFGVQLNLAI